MEKHSGESLIVRAARSTMDNLDTGSTENFCAIVKFLEHNQHLAPNFRNKVKPVFGSQEWLSKMAMKYLSGLQRKSLPQPGTVPDPALSVVMIEGYGILHEDVVSLINGHRTAMVAENVVGDLLERYLALSLGKGDWVWAAGEVVKSVDFIREPNDQNTSWEALQIKNRDNSENSSSAAVRIGTEIKKWHRTVSKTGVTRWELFPARVEGTQLSESGFQNFVVQYIRELNTKGS